MNIRNEIKNIAALGVVDDCDEISEDVLLQFSDCLESINAILNFDEALILSRYFPNKPCYEIEWAIIHLIETSEGYGVETICNMPNLYWKGILINRLVDLM